MTKSENIVGVRGTNHAKEVFFGCLVDFSDTPLSRERIEGYLSTLSAVKFEKKDAIGCPNMYFITSPFADDFIQIGSFVQIHKSGYPW